MQARSSVRSTHSRHGINGKANGLCSRTISEPASKAARIHSANDWRSYLVSANELKELLNEAPDSLLEIARADVHVDDLKAAFRELEQFTRMGQSTDLLAKSSDFVPLLKNANFARIQNAMKANQSLISTGSTAFQLSDPNLLTEDVDYDPNTQRFLITSVREKKIVSVEASGASADFARAPNNWPMLAVKVDSSRRLVWATEVAMQGFNFAPESDWGRSAALCYDLRSGKCCGASTGHAEVPWATWRQWRMAMSSLVTEREEACTGCQRKVPYWNAWTTGISSPLKLRRCIRMGSMSSCLIMRAGLVFWKLQRSRCAGFRCSNGLPSTGSTGCISITEN